MDFLGLAVPILFSPAGANDSNLTVQSAHNALPPILYNSLCAEIAVLMDALGDPLRSAQAEHSGQQLAVDNYRGPQSIVSGAMTTMQVPVFGTVPRPADVERALWWDALADLAQRIADGVTWVQGANNVQKSDQRVVLLVGPASHAAVSVDGQMAANPAGYTFSLPQDISDAWAGIMSGTAAYAQRLQAIANGSSDPSVMALSDFETAIRPQIVAMGAEIQKRRKMNRWYFGGGILAGTGLGAAIGQGIRMMRRGGGGRKHA